MVTGLNSTTRPPNRVCGTVDKVDRDRNSPNTEYRSIHGSDIDIVQVTSRQIISYRTFRPDLYCTWASVREERGKEKEQSDVSARCVKSNQNVTKDKLHTVPK